MIIQNDLVAYAASFIDPASPPSAPQRLVKQMLNRCACDVEEQVVTAANEVEAFFEPNDPLLSGKKTEKSDMPKIEGFFQEVIADSDRYDMLSRFIDSQPNFRTRIKDYFCFYGRN